MFPLLIQILGAIYNEAKLFTMRKKPVVLVAFGTVQVMAGLFIIGLKLVVGNYRLTLDGADHVLGALFITCGFVSFLSHHSVWWVSFTAFMNLLTVAWTIVGVIMYGADLKNIFLDRSYNTQKLMSCLVIFSMVLTVVQMCICISLAVICIRDMIRREKEEQIEEDCEVSKEAMTSPSA